MAESDRDEVQQPEKPYSSDAAAIFDTLASSEQGLSKEEAQRRQARFGENALPMAPPTPAWKRFLAQFRNLLIYVLIVSGLISVALGHYVDSGVIFAVVLVNALIGFIQEGKAEAALRGIMSMTRTHCMVLRDGSLRSVDSSELVPGDVVMVQAGDRIPADLRLFYCKDLRCDESALTGEAQPVGKNTAVLDDESPLAERRNMAYMGTLANYGTARGVVCATGVNTEIGRISEMVQGVTLPQTPLQKQLKQFAQYLTAGILVVALATMLVGFFLRGYGFDEVFQAAIGIAVASIPEGLPAIVTIALAIGVQRMAARKALVRRLPAVEVLGSVDVICSDKTGTLTANAMTAREAVTAAGRFQVSGTGYCPEGAITSSSDARSVEPEEDSALNRASLIAMLCNDATVSEQDGDWVMHGDPTEGALLVLAMKHGLSPTAINRDWPRNDLLPFESERRYMATLHGDSGGEILLAVKGAPDRLLQFSQTQLGEDGPEAIDREHWSTAMDELAGQGMRVMALAQRRFEQAPDSLSPNHAEEDLCLVALVGISDPPRPEAIDSIRQCHEAGIRVKMITGDNGVTAGAIGRELGLRSERVITGQDLDNLPPDQLPDTVDQVDIFARTSPTNKLQLVNSLQSARHVVAMTGDGVNDSPALKQADIGVAMGMKGTDAAREASDFVLTDDNFSTIARAVSEGRTVYDNIVKSIIFILPTNLAEAAIIILAILAGRMLPITPAQILWINMITAVTLALSLAFERPEAGVMGRPPRPYGQRLITLPLLSRMVIVGLAGAAVVFYLFNLYRSEGAEIELARSIAVNGLVLVEAFYLINCRFLTRSIFTLDTFRGARPVMLAILAVLAFQLAFTYLPPSQQLFDIRPLSLGDWLLIIAVSAPILLVVEAEKFFWRRFSSRRVV